MLAEKTESGSGAGAARVLVVRVARAVKRARRVVLVYMIVEGSRLGT